LNTTLIDDLQGKVIILFSPEGIAALNNEYGPGDGITAFKSLYDKKEPATYSAQFQGLQYWGKGGTSVNPLKSKDKIQQNIDKQGKIHRKGREFPHMSPEVLGMMYWTTTGLKESIEERNNPMWEDDGRRRLKELWGAGMEQFVDGRNPHSHYHKGRYFRENYIPNIIMIDFADENKIQTIFELNSPQAQQHLINMPVQALNPPPQGGGGPVIQNPPRQGGGAWVRGV
jgi:hypothetical protein